MTEDMKARAEAAKSIAGLVGQRAVTRMTLTLDFCDHMAMYEPEDKEEKEDKSKGDKDATEAEDGSGDPESGKSGDTEVSK